MKIERGWKMLCIIEFSIEHLSGKKSIELIKEKNIETSKE